MESKKMNHLRQFNDIEDYKSYQTEILNMLYNDTQQLSEINTKWPHTSNLKLGRPFKKVNDTYYYNTIMGITIKKYPYNPYVKIVSGGKKYTILSSDFINSTLISYVIADKMDVYGMPLNIIYNNYIEKKEIFQFMNDCSSTLIDFVDDYDKVEIYENTSTKIVRITSKNSIIDILKQISASLIYLKTEFSFRGNRVIASEIGIRVEPVKYKYDNIEVDSDFTFFISNFDHSYIKIKKNDTQYEIFEGNELVRKPHFTYDGGYYKLDTWSVLKFNSDKSVLVPLEWDIVTFVVSLLLMPRVYFSVVTDSGLRNQMIHQIFHESDIQYLMSNIRKNHGKSSYESITGILSNVRFKKVYI